MSLGFEGISTCPKHEARVAPGEGLRAKAPRRNVLVPGLKEEVIYSENFGIHSTILPAF